MPELSRFYSKNIEDLRDLVWLVDASMFDDPQIKRHGNSSETIAY